jgi:Arc/MetJ-type ribon-helix-helix transcriptional regulator
VIDYPRHHRRGELRLKTIQTEIPEQLYNKARALVKEGWFRDEQDIFSEAIRRFLDSHGSELMEKFLRDDVEWGLRGVNVP